MATPDDTQWIEITDFSAGVWADTHGALSPRYTAADDTTGTQLGNGMARVANTYGCRADQHGSLIPLPRAQASGIRDSIRPALEYDHMRPHRYVLDAQLGPSLTDIGETQVSPFIEPIRQSVQIIWTAHVIPEM